MLLHPPSNPCLHQVVPERLGAMAALALATSSTIGFTADLAAMIAVSGVGPIFTKYLEDIEIRDVLDVQAWQHPRTGF